MKKGTLIALREHGLNEYHHQRLVSGGRLYTVNRAYGPLIEARSLTTGRVYTLDKAYMERLPDGT